MCEISLLSELSLLAYLGPAGQRHKLMVPLLLALSHNCVHVLETLERWSPERQTIKKNKIKKMVADEGRSCDSRGEGLKDNMTPKWLFVKTPTLLIWTVHCKCDRK